MSCQRFCRFPNLPQYVTWSRADRKNHSFTLGCQEFRDVVDKLLNREAGERLYEWRSDLSQKSKSEL